MQHMSKRPLKQYIRDDYYQHPNQRQSTQASGLQKQDGRYEFQLGETLNNRYHILKKLGEGTFGQVLECWDQKCQENVAIKVTRNTGYFKEAAKKEIKVLRLLAKHDASGLQGCIQFKHWFHHQGHICIVCERLGPSIDNVLRKMRRSFTLHQVCQIGQQILSSLRYMHEKCSLIHTDVKTANILMETSDYAQDGTDMHVKVIDFGSAVFENVFIINQDIATTRSYRAPEIVLGLGWSYPCDIWSVGCVLVELITGEILFQLVDDDLKHLGMMKMLLGPMPSWIMEKGRYSNKHIKKKGLLPPLKNLIQKHVSNPEIAREFEQLLEGMLNYDPASRLTAAQALSHPFFKHASLPPRCTTHSTTSFNDKVKRWLSFRHKDRTEPGRQKHKTVTSTRIWLSQYFSWFPQFRRTKGCYR